MSFDEEELDPHGECAAEIGRLRAAIAEALDFLDSSASVTDNQRINNAVVTLTDALGDDEQQAEGK